MYSALTLDFYGTLVEEDTGIITRIAREVATAARRAVSADEVLRSWSRSFSRLCAQSYGASFRSQRALERESLVELLAEFGAALDPDALSAPLFAHWRAPRPLPGAAEFLERLGLPVCIVSNIDAGDLRAAIASAGWSFAHVVTSESCGGYKPRRELFDAALRALGSVADETLHVGDSLGSDLAGAAAAGMPFAWVYAAGRELPSGARAAHVVRDVRSLLARISDRTAAR